MSLVTAIHSYHSLNSCSPRLHKKKKIKVTLDNVPHHSWVIPTTIKHPLEEVSKRQWENEVRRISLCALPHDRILVESNKINRSEGCLACTVSRKSSDQHTPQGSPEILPVKRQTKSVDSGVKPSLLTTGNDSLSPLNKCHKHHSHSDFCLRQHVHLNEHSGVLQQDEPKPQIEIVSSHSSLKCGTNYKTWTVKVDIRPFLPHGEVSVTAEGKLVKIKVKYGDKHKGLVHHIFGSGKKEVKRALKFAGTVEPSSLRTNNDKEGFLTIDFYEQMSFFNL